MIEEGGNGYCVYSGGDDLLAFLPLENSLQAIKKIRLSFSDGFKRFKGMGAAPTLSAGIVILHHHDPLRKGLIEARRSVENAKEWFIKKDAFFITLRISSGSVITWGSKWTIDDFTIRGEDGVVKIYLIQVFDLLKRFVSFMTADQGDGLSTDFIHDLMRELPAFYKYNEYKLNWSFSDEMFKTEFKRLLKRHIPEKSNLWNDQVTTLDLITEVFAHLAGPDNNKQMNVEHKNRVKDNFEHLLQIASFLAREQIWRSDKR